MTKKYTQEQLHDLALDIISEIDYDLWKDYMYPEEPEYGPSTDGIINIIETFFDLEVE